MLRLGSLVAATGEVGETAATAAVDVVRRFRALAESLEADELVACATAALREARDSAWLVDRIEAETGVKVRVISGREEARLIFGAVRASVVIDPGPALALDLGGGSLELMVGDAKAMAWSASLKLGVGRLTADLVRADPPTGGDRRRIVHAVTTAVGRVLPDITQLGAPAGGGQQRHPRDPDPTGSGPPGWSAAGLGQPAGRERQRPRRPHPGSAAHDLERAGRSARRRRPPGRSAAGGGPAGHHRARPDRAQRAGGLRVGPARGNGPRRHRAPLPGRVDRRSPGHAAGVGAGPVPALRLERGPCRSRSAGWPANCSTALPPCTASATTGSCWS